MKLKILFLSLFIFSVMASNADEPVRFVASAPSTVILDKPFQLVFTANATCKDLRVPEFTNFDVLAGPFESHSSSIQYVNGKSSSSVSVSYTYTLQAQKTGTFTIPSASVMVDSKKVTSNGVSIKVLPADATPPASKSQGNQGGGGQSSISGDNLFIKTEVSKTNVYEQEAILVTYKLYTLVDVVQCNPKNSVDFNGFMKQELEQPTNKQMALENYNGRNYGTFVLYKVLLYPQHSGVIQIDKWNFEAVVRIQNRQTVRSMFDDFFDSYTNVSKYITAPAVKVTVNPLPTANKPSSFNGTVGHFTLNTNITTTDVKANDAVTLKLNIAGSGNMKLIKNPVIKFPDGFELYDPKVTNNFKTSPSGVSGTKTIEYLFIPRHSGSFEIPSTEISYFDTQEKCYKVLKTPAYKLQVAKGDGTETPVVAGGSNYVDKQDIKQIGKDIRYINTDKFEISLEQEPVFGSLIAWLIYIIPLFVSVLLFIFFRKQAKENSNLSLMKNKKANKVAHRRLKLAQKLLNEGNKDSFYDEVLKATWTYLSDKLTIPVASLTKERVNDELTELKVDNSIINQFIQILNTCEFARFAPNSGQQEMGNLYIDTIQAISDLEEKFKRK